MTKETYKRKYYLIREIKKDGFNLVSKKRERIIYITSEMVDAAAKNKYLRELQQKHDFGIQLTNQI